MPSSRIPIPATLATARTGTPGAMAAAPAPPASCAPRVIGSIEPAPDARGFAARQHADAPAPLLGKLADERYPPPGGLRGPDRLRAHHSRGQLADRPCRHGLRARWSLPDPGSAGHHGALRRADDRAGSGVAGPGAAAAWPWLCL